MRDFLKKNLGYIYVVLGTVIGVSIALYTPHPWLLPVLLFVLFYPFFLSLWIRQRRRKLIIAVFVFLFMLFVLVNVLTPFFPSRAETAFFHHDFSWADREYGAHLGKPGIDNIFREGVSLLIIAGGVSALSLLTVGILYVPAMTLIVSSYGFHMAKFFDSQTGTDFTVFLPVMGLAILKILISALWGLIFSEILISKVFSYTLKFKDLFPVFIPALVLTFLDLAIAASL